MRLNHSRLELVAAILAGLLTALGIFWWMVYYADERGGVTVVAAGRDLKAPLRLTEGDFELIELPRDRVPATAAVQAEQLVGATLLRSAVRHQVLTRADVASERDPSSEAILVPADLIGMALPGSWFVAPIPKVKKNDFISIATVAPGRLGAAAVSGIVISHLPVLAAAGDNAGAPSALFVGATPEGASRLLQLYTSRYPLIILVEPGGALTSSTSF